MLVYKCASALADEGADIDAVYDMSEFVNTRVGTIGVGLEHCHVSLYHASHLGHRGLEQD